MHAALYGPGGFYARGEPPARSFPNLRARVSKLRRGDLGTAPPGRAGLVIRGGSTWWTSARPGRTAGTVLAAAVPGLAGRIAAARWRSRRGRPGSTPGSAGSPSAGGNHRTGHRQRMARQRPAGKCGNSPRRDRAVAAGGPGHRRRTAPGARRTRKIWPGSCLVAGDARGDRAEVGRTRCEAWAGVIRRIDRGVAVRRRLRTPQGGRPAWGTLTSYLEGRAVARSRTGPVTSPPTWLWTPAPRPARTQKERPRERAHYATGGAAGTGPERAAPLLALAAADRARLREGAWPGVGKTQSWWTPKAWAVSAAGSGGRHEPARPAGAAGRWRSRLSRDSFLPAVLPAAAHPRTRRRAHPPATRAPSARAAPIVVVSASGHTLWWSLALTATNAAVAVWPGSLRSVATWADARARRPQGARPGPPGGGGHRRLAAWKRHRPGRAPGKQRRPARRGRGAGRSFSSTWGPPIRRHTGCSGSGHRGRRPDHGGEPEIGFMHRGAEKLFGARTTARSSCWPTGMTGWAPSPAKLGRGARAERLAGIEVPPRAVWARTRLAELTPGAESPRILERLPARDRSAGSRRAVGCGAGSGRAP
jgi:hypothetical protein